MYTLSTDYNNPHLICIRQQNLTKIQDQASILRTAAVVLNREGTHIALTVLPSSQFASWAFKIPRPTPPRYIGSWLRPVSASYQVTLKQSSLVFHHILNHYLTLVTSPKEVPHSASDDFLRRQAKNSTFSYAARQADKKDDNHHRIRHPQP